MSKERMASGRRSLRRGSTRRRRREMTRAYEGDVYIIQAWRVGEHSWLVEAEYRPERSEERAAGGDIEG